ncbi:MAG: phospho-N-acetylmuramoyl-pentapeptide-transferase [Opitutales bacterium]
MLEYLSTYEDIFGPFRLFGSLTFRCIMAGAFAAIIAFMIAPRLISYLKELKFNQFLRTQEEVGELAILHKDKVGTPTMGGLMIFASLTISTLLWAKLNTLIVVSLFVYISLTILGFLDDYLKIAKNNSAGVSGKIKMLVQLLVAIGAVCILKFSDYAYIVESLYLPFFKSPVLTSIPFWALIIGFFFVIAGSSNAVNLTDGVDGLAIGCTISVALTYGVFAYITGHMVAAQYLLLPYIAGSGELCVLLSALLGASFAFLWYNAHPASIFMGDTGSLAIGGLIGVVAILVAQPATLVIVGGIFVLETISVIIQRYYYKATKKRFFKCAPVHHHFERSGWKETQVVIRFWLLSLIFALLGLATLKLR